MTISSSVTFVLISACLHIILSHPTPENDQLPKVNISTPLEVNSLIHHYNDINFRMKHFKEMVNANAKSQNQILTTVKEVEDIIKNNPKLPQLTRGEILDIIDNITKTDAEKVKRARTRDKDQRAIMVVMPYTSENTNASKMEDLYTKPPVTHLIGDSDKPANTNNAINPNYRRRRPTAFLKTTVTPKPQQTSFVRTEVSIVEKSTFRPNFFSVFLRRNPAPTTNLRKTSTQTHVSSTTTTKPTQSSFQRTPEIPVTNNIVHRRRRPEVITQRPLYQEQTYTAPQPFEVNTEYGVSKKLSQAKSPADRFPNHKYPEENASKLSIPSQGLNVIDPPNLASTKFVRFTTTKPSGFQPTIVTVQPLLVNEQVLNKIMSKPLLDDIEGPDMGEDVKFVIDNVDLTRAVQQNQNGQTTTEKVPSTAATTTTASHDLSNVADSLSPDMRDLLMAFGLIPDPTKQPTPTNMAEERQNTETADVRPESYMQFKPLPDNAPTREEMDDFLAGFGLGRGAKKVRKEKQLKIQPLETHLSAPPNIEIEMIPASMRGVLADIGLIDREGKKIRSDSIQKTQEKQHVFKPVDTEFASNDEINKLNELLEVIKQLEKLNRTATEMDLKNLTGKNLHELVSGFNQEPFITLDLNTGAPDPLNDDNGLSKNEVKRQENDTTTVSLTTPTLASTSTSTTEVADGPNIKDLEDSFGGPSETVSQATPAALPEPSSTIRTGFYYLVDWNSFLDIDDTKGKRVNLRFQPKAGDASRFFSVNVP